MHLPPPNHNNTTEALSTSPAASNSAGSRIIVLIADNQASKLAFKLAKALLQPRDELLLVTVVLGEDSVKYGSDLLAPYVPAEQQTQTQQQTVGPTITPVVSSWCMHADSETVCWLFVCLVAGCRSVMHVLRAAAVCVCCDA